MHERLCKQVEDFIHAQQQSCTSQHHQQQLQQSPAQQHHQQSDTQQHKVESQQQLPQQRQQQACQSQQQLPRPLPLLPHSLCVPSQPLLQALQGGPLTQPLQGGAAAGMPTPSAAVPEATTELLPPHPVANPLQMQKAPSLPLPRANAQLSGTVKSATCYPCLMTNPPVWVALSVVRRAVVSIATRSMLAAWNRLLFWSIIGGRDALRVVCQRALSCLLSVATAVSAPIVVHMACALRDALTDLQHISRL